MFEDVYDYCEEQEHRHRHADPRGRRRPDGDQLLPRRSAGAGRPGLPLQAHGARGGAAPRHVRHLHGEADRGRAGQRHARAPELCENDDGQQPVRRPDGTPQPQFCSATSRGLQQYLPAAMPLFAPNVNSYRRLRRWSTRPSTSNGASTTAPSASACLSRRRRRAASRTASSAPTPIPTSRIAATLACGYLGMIERTEADRPDQGQRLPSGPYPAAARVRGAQQAARQQPLSEMLRRTLRPACHAVKQAEYDAYQRVISSWEREHLLLNV